MPILIWPVLFFNDNEIWTTVHSTLGMVQSRRFSKHEIFLINIVRSREISSKYAAKMKNEFGFTARDSKRFWIHFWNAFVVLYLCASLLLYVMHEKIHIVCFLKPLENWFLRIIWKKNGSSLDARKCIGIFLDSILSRINNLNEFFMWKRLKYFSLSCSASKIQRILSHFPTPLYYISWMWNINGRFC